MRIPKNNLAYPVLITLENGGTGSGFLINSGKATYFVTARHVFFKDDQTLRSHSAEILCMSPDIPLGDASTFRIDFKKQSPKYHKSADVCVFLFATVISENDDKSGWKISYNPSVEILRVNEKGTVSVNLNMAVRTFDKVEISNNIFLYGFPTSLGLKGKKQFFDFSKPLLRTGIIANVYAEEKTIILDCAVYYGNSGGPVIEEVRNEQGQFEHYIIGVVSKFIPYEQEWVNHREKIVHQEVLNSGYSVASSIDFVIELIKEYE
jgi:hypothetical protein